MKNFTKQNFKTNPLWIRLLIMAFMLLAGAGNAWGANLSANTVIYFDASEFDDIKSDIAGGKKLQLMIGHSSWSQGYIMDAVSGYCSLYKVTMPKWDGCTQIAFMTQSGTTAWSGEGNSVSHRLNYNDGHETGVHNISGNISGTVCFSGTGTLTRTNSYSLPTNNTYTATISFKRPSGWANTPNIHIFDSSCDRVSNTAMTDKGTATDGGHWFEYTYNFSSHKTKATVMFNNGGWDNGKTNSNFEITLGTSYCLTGGSSTDVATATCPVYCTSPAAPTISNAGNLVLCNGSPTTNGKIKITTINNGSTYYYKEGTSGTATKITSIANDGTFTVSAAGDYYVMEENDCGSESAWSTKVTITSTDNTPTISEDVTISGTNWVCPGGSTELTANVSTAGTVSYSWTPNVGTTQSVAVSPIENTDYSVTVTVTNDGCSKDFSTTTPYAVTAYKVSSVTTNDAVQVTETTAMLSASNVTIGGNPSEDNISWGFELSTDGGATYDTRSVSYNKGTSFSLRVDDLNDNTTYSYRAYVKDKNCGTYYGEWKEFKTLVACTPTTVTISPNPIPSCNVGSLTLTATVKLQSTGDVIANPGGTFTWSKFGANGAPSSISGVTGNEYTVTESGKFYVTYNRGESNYCTSNSHNNYTTYTIVTIENPTASIEGDACVKSTGTTYSHTGSTFTAYEWVADPAASMTITGANTATPTVKFNTGYTTGTLKFRGTTAAGCQSDWATKTLNAEPTVSPSQSAGAICDGETLTLQLSYTNATSFKWFKDGVEIAGETSKTLTVSAIGTYYAVVSNEYGCSAQTENIVISDKFGSNVTPSIDGPASTQTGATATYTASNISGATYSWTLPTGWSITSGEGTNTITVSIPTTEGNGTVSVAVTNNGCTKSATKEVQWMNGFTVYLRRPHATNEKTQYNYWFEKSGTASPGYVKFGTVKTNPTGTEMYGYNGGTSATTKDPNEVAVKGTEAFTDCDGYVWDAYNIGIDVTALYFRAPNDKATNNTFYGGYATYTLSYTQNTPIAENMYFTMGDWTSNKQYGRALNKVDAPFSGITIAALGSTEICSNNEASFAALYLKTNCTRKEILSYQWKYSSDNANWSDYEPVQCTYRVEDETAEYKDEQTKSSQTNNIRPTEAGWYRLECMLEDSPTPVVSDAIEITTKECEISDASLYTFKSSLPIIMVNTGGEGFPSCVNNSDFPSQHVDAMKKKRSVDVKIKMPDGSIYYDRKARMNYRGSSSLNFEKKSFAFCPGEANCGDKKNSEDYVKTTKMNLFGLSNNALDKDWVLYAAYPDPSMIRNVLNMEVYAVMTGKWGCTNQHVELYIDGEYRGVYVFMDKITKNKKRVNVKWEVKNKENVKKGFILKFDKTDIEDRIENSEGDQKTFATSLTGSSGEGIESYDTYFDQRFEIEYPEKEDIQDDGGSWSSVVDFIKGKVEAFENALMSDNFTEVRKHIDYETWADYFIINEYSKNEDAYRASCVFVYNETTDKIEAWPLWDYELSMDNSVAGQGKGGGDKTGLIINNAAMYSDGFKAPFWWTGQYKGSNACAGLLNDPCFAQMIKSRWDDHIADNGELNPKKIAARVSTYETLLKDAYVRESTRWPYDKRGKAQCNVKNTGYYEYGGGGSNTNYENSLKELKAWIAENGRLPELTKEINKLVADIDFSLTVTGDKDTTTPWRPVNVTVNAVGADFTYEVTPAMAEGQVVEGTGNLLVYPGYSDDLPKDYTVTVTLDAKDQCGASGDNIKETVTFTVENLEANCEE